MMASPARSALTLACLVVVVAVAVAVPSKLEDKSDAKSVNATADITSNDVTAVDDVTTPADATNGTGAGDQYAFRDLPADVLRDFPGFCFGSTALRLFKVGQSWSLSPFCGVASCLTTDDGSIMVERVQDCGPQPKRSPRCKNTNARSEAAFPACCPVYKCEEGAALEYPSPQELAGLAQEAAQAAVRAQYEQTEEETEEDRTGRHVSAEATASEETTTVAA